MKTKPIGDVAEFWKLVKRIDTSKKSETVDYEIFELVYELEDWLKRCNPKNHLETEKLCDILCHELQRLANGLGRRITCRDIEKIKISCCLYACNELKLSLLTQVFHEKFDWRITKKDMK